MDTREAALSLLDLVLASEKQIHLNHTTRVQVNVGIFNQLHGAISEFDAMPKVGCETGDIACQRRCKQRRKRIIQFVKSTLSNIDLSDLTVPDKVQLVLQETGETYKQANNPEFADIFQGMDFEPTE